MKANVVTFKFFVAIKSHTNFDGWETKKYIGKKPQNSLKNYGKYIRRTTVKKKSLAEKSHRKTQMEKRKIYGKHNKKICWLKNSRKKLQKYSSFEITTMREKTL